MEGYINFKKPQNEMFKKLDGKIQKLVAAHSNLNKLYALNDFPSVGVGPKRPFELPPQLPPPPPWIPKVGNSTEFNPSNVQWNEDNNKKPPMIDCSSPPLPLPPHQKTQSAANLSPEDKRKFQENLIELLKEQIATVAKSSKFKFTTPPRPKSNNEQRSLLLKSSPQTLFNTIRRETSLLLNKRVQQIHQNHKQQQLSGRSGLSLLSHQQTCNRQYPPQEKYTLNIRPLQQPHHQNHQQQRQPQFNQHHHHYHHQHQQQEQQHHHHQQQPQQHRVINKLHHSIKVVVPPTEFDHNNVEKLKDVTESNNNNLMQSTTGSSVMIKQETPRPSLTYQVIKNKMKLFQEINQIYFCKSPYGIGFGNSNLIRKKSSQKSIDNVINRLRAKCSPSPTNIEVNIGPTTSDSLNVATGKKASNFQQQIIYSSASLLQTSRNLSTISAPTPIPVFRSPVTTNAIKGGYFQTNSKIVKMKSKKSKRVHLFGLKLSNYLEKEIPQPTNEKITIEQFASCLNLVRTNDASLQLRKQQLSQSESKYRLPISNRPLRLRRLRGERIYMPASSSYKATRKVGLQ